jgi:hypothetical protein
MRPCLPSLVCPPHARSPAASSGQTQGQVVSIMPALLGGTAAGHPTHDTDVDMLQTALMPSLNILLTVVC